MTLVLAVTALISQLAYDGKQLSFESARAFRGDEPHYLLVINSLLGDHDLDLRADYARVRRGGAQAGVGFRRYNLDHHTYIIDTATGRHKNWTEVFQWDRGVPCPADNPDCVGFAVKNDSFAAVENVREVSSHPIAFPAALAAAIAPWWKGPDETEAQAGHAMLVIVLVGIVLTYFLGRAAGLTRPFALGATALLALGSPWLVFAKSFFSEPLIGVALLVGMWSLLTHRPRAAAVAIVAAVWLKPIFVLVGMAWVVTLWLRAERRAALWHGGIQVAGVLALWTANFAIAHTPLVAGNLGWTGIEKWWWPARTLIDLEHGLLPFAPWAAFGLAAIALGFARALKRSPDANPQFTRFASFAAPPIALLLVLYAAHGPLGGTCYGPRYWVPLLPWLAVALADIVARRRCAIRVLAIEAVLIAVLIAVPGALMRHRAWDRHPQVPVQMMLE